MTSPAYSEWIDPTADPRLRSHILGYAMTDWMTDVERARFFGLAEGCRIRERAKILCPEKFECGKNLWIGEGVILDAQGGLTIGDETQVGSSVMIWTHTSHLQALNGETGAGKERIIYKPTTIGRRCFIGGPSVILPGVTIGDGVLIPPMSVVAADLPDGTFYKDTRHQVKALEERVAELEQQIALLLAVKQPK